MRRLFFLAVFIVLAACQPNVDEPLPPTLAALPTVTPSHTPEPATATPIATATPEATLAPLPRSIADDPNQQAYIRVAQAIPQLPIVDVYIERLSIATNLRYGLATGQAGIEAGTYTLRVVPSGNRYNEEPILETQFMIEGAKSLILVLSGSIDDIRLNTYFESNTPLGQDTSRVSFIHAAASAPDLLITANDEALANGVTFGQAVEYLKVSAGRNDLRFINGETPLFEWRFELRGGFNYTFIIIEGETPQQLDVIEIATRAPSVTNIRFINALASAQSVDVYLDDMLMARLLTFGRSTDREQIQSQTYTLSIYPTGADPVNDNALLITPLRANPNETVSIILAGTDNNLRLITYRDDLSPVPEGEARVTFVHTVPDAPVARLESSAGPFAGAVGDLRYGDISPSVTIAGGSEYSLFWNKVENNAPTDLLEEVNSVRFEAGRSYLYLFTGAMSAPPIVFSDPVGFEESIIRADEVEEFTPVPRLPTRLRVVNAFESEAPVNVYLNDILLVEELSIGQSSELFIVPNGDNQLSAELVAEESYSVARELELFPEQTYTLFVYGTPLTAIDMLLVDDGRLTFDGESPHLRLVNLTQGDIVPFGIGFMAPDNTLLPPGPDDDYRYYFTRGITHLIRDVTNGLASVPIRPPIGTYTYLVTDNSDNTVAWVFPPQSLEVGVHYDMIAFQDTQSRRVSAFLVRYPQP